MAVASLEELLALKAPSRWQRLVCRFRFAWRRWRSLRRGPGHPPGQPASPALADPEPVAGAADQGKGDAAFATVEERAMAFTLLMAAHFSLLPDLTDREKWKLLQALGLDPTSWLPEEAWFRHQVGELQAMGQPEGSGREGERP